MKNVTSFHEDARKIRNDAKNGKMHHLEARNNLDSIYTRAARYMGNHMPTNKTARNRNANKLQEMLRWSQGYWNYKAR